MCWKREMFRRERRRALFSFPPLSSGVPSVTLGVADMVNVSVQPAAAWWMTSVARSLCPLCCSLPFPRAAVEPHDARICANIGATLFGSSRTVERHQFSLDCSICLGCAAHLGGRRDRAANRPLFWFISSSFACHHANSSTPL